MTDSPAPSHKLDQYMLRMPDGMRDRIKAAAEKNKRSMNAEIIATLEEHYPEPKLDFTIGEVLTGLRRLAVEQNKGDNAALKETLDRIDLVDDMVRAIATGSEPAFEGDVAQHLYELMTSQGLVKPVDPDYEGETAEVRINLKGADLSPQPSADVDHLRPSSTYIKAGGRRIKKRK